MCYIYKLQIKYWIYKLYLKLYITIYKYIRIIYIYNIKIIYKLKSWIYYNN